MSDAHDHGHHGPTNFWTKYVFSTDHKVIALQFTFSSLLFVILGGLLAMGVRYQIAWPGQDVPYATILPGGTVDEPKDSSFQKMTSPVPEKNLALWKIGGTVSFNQAVEHGSNNIPKGTKASLLEFSRGLAVTVPVGARVKIDGRTRTLTKSVDGFIDHQRVGGDIDFTKAVPHVHATTGEMVKADDEGTELELIGLMVNRPDGQTELNESHILIPVRIKATPATVQITAQSVEGAGDVAAATIELSSAQVLTYTKQQLTADAYLSLFTMHASIMIFFVIIPMLVGGFGNFTIPLMIGARDMAFPKLNMLSFWISVPVSILIVASFWVPAGSAGGGWTMYPPLSGGKGGVMSSTIGTNLWIIGVGMVGFVSIVGALNYVTTIINMRAPGMSMFRLPLTVWALFITAILQVFATPVLTATMILLFFDRVLGTMFFAPIVQQLVDGVPVMKSVGGQPLLFQHLFWFYSHPAVYIMILPAMGVASDVIAAYARKPIFGYRPMVYAICAIAILGFIVWGHHMFQSGMNPVLGTTFMASTILIAVPSAIKTFNWLGTLWGGDIRFTPAMLHALGFVSMFVIGGLSGIFMASAPVDIYIHDTYFIVAHIHYVLFGGSIFGIFAGIYHWFPKMFGREMNIRWGYVHFWLTFIAFNGTFFIMHVLGVGGHPRRYASIMEYPTLQHLQPMNVIMTLWAMSLGMAQIPFFYNFFVSMPRKLGRSIVATFLVILVGSTVIGVSYWTGPAWEVTDGRAIAADAGARNWLGYIALFAGLIALLVMWLRSLPRISKVFSVLIIVPLMLYFLGVIQSARAGALVAVNSQVLHDLMVATGHGIIAGGIVVVVVFIIWAIGGALGVPALLQRVLYLVFLPAFLAPFILKDDVYLLLGMASLMEHRWVILFLAAIPGLLYLILQRPRDEFGAKAEINPHDLNSLEWVAQSPPIHTNFDEIPTVYRGPYEYSSPAVEEDFLPQNKVLPQGVVEPTGH